MGGFLRMIEMLHKGHKMFELGKQSYELGKALWPVPKFTSEELESWLVDYCKRVTSALPESVEDYLINEEISATAGTLVWVKRLPKIDMDTDDIQDALERWKRIETHHYLTKEYEAAKIIRHYKVPVVINYKDKHGRSIGTNAIPAPNSFLA